MAQESPERQASDQQGCVGPTYGTVCGKETVWDRYRWCEECRDITHRQFDDALAAAETGEDTSRFVNSTRSAVRQLAAESPCPLNRETYEALIGDEDNDVRLALIKRDDIPEYALRHMCSHDNPYVLGGLMDTRPELPEWAWMLLAKHKDQEVRSKLVRVSQALPLRVLRKLSTDRTHYVRYALSKRSDVPSDVLYGLMSHKNSHVQSAAVRNPRMPAATLRRFAESSDREFDYAVMQNPAAPADVLVTLYRKRFEQPRHLSWSKAKARMMTTLAAHPSMPQHMIDNMLRDFREMVSEGIVKNHAVSGEQFASAVENIGRLADKTKAVTAALSHPLIDDNLLCLLLPHANTDQALRIVGHAARGQQTTEAILRSRSYKVKAALILRLPDIDPEQLEQFSSGRDVLRAAVAAHGNTDEETLGDLSVDREPTVRKAVADNPNADESMLALLAFDSDAEVAQYATEKLAEHRSDNS